MRYVGHEEQDSEVRFNILRAGVGLGVLFHAQYVVYANDTPDPVLSYVLVQGSV